MSRRALALSLVLAVPLTAGGVYLAWRAVSPPEPENGGGQFITAAVEESAPDSRPESEEWIAEEPIEEIEEEPILEDFECTDGEADRSTDSPFDSTNSNSMLGIGGGAGGKYAGRFGGRRSLGASTHFEQYAAIEAVSTFKDTRANPAVTFAADVDTGSYTNVRRMILQQSVLPPKDAVRVEEFLNYFPYQGLDPVGDAPIGAHIEVSSCPWNGAHRLAHVVLRTTPIAASNRQPANLVFLLDVSGSMEQPNKLPLLKDALGMLTNELQGRDRVAIVVYAGAAGLVLPSTACSNKDVIRDSLEQLRAGGSTAGAAGIELAYRVAEEHLVSGGINRVILATDGDFNVGISDRETLVETIEEKARGGVFLTTLGFGTGNLNEALLEQLADHGNGNYAYIDSRLEARKVLVEELGATLAVCAKDVKLQLQIDPARYAAHRLVGYANRRMTHRDFDDDRKDGGELGAGHEVTALLELVPHGTPLPGGVVVQAGTDDVPVKAGSAAIELRVRYKEPEADESQLLTFSAEDTGGVIATAAEDMRFAAAVAWFGEELAAEERGWRPFRHARKLAAGAMVEDPGGYRAGLLTLIDAAEKLAR